MKLSTTPRTKAVAGLAIVALGLMLSVSQASAQTRGDRVAERRALAEQRLESIAANRAERTVRRTEVFTHLTEVSPEMVQERLDQAEIIVLMALADADEELAASRINTLGVVAEQVLTTQDIEKLTDEEIDTLVAAAARAASITPEEVEILLAVTTIEVTELFNSIDAEEIAAALNEIGEKALDIEVVQ